MRVTFYLVLFFNIFLDRPNDRIQSSIIPKTTLIFADKSTNKKDKLLLFFQLKTRLFVCFENDFFSFLFFLHWVAKIILFLLSRLV